MSDKINSLARNLSRNFDFFLENISESLIGQFKTNDPIINPEAQIILQNPLDRKAVDEAVQELKNNREVQQKTIILSNKKEITLSVH